MIQTLSQKFRFLGILFFLGIFCAQFFEKPFYVAIFSFFLLFSVWIYFFLGNKKVRICIALFFGLFWGTFFPKINVPNVDISTRIGISMNVSGEIISYPEFRENDIRFFAKIDEFFVSNDDSQKSQEKILFIVPISFKNLQYGDIFTAEIIPVLPTSINRAEFDYREYLWQRNVRLISKNPKKFEISSEKSDGFVIFRWAQNLRNFFLNNVSDIIPKTHTNIAMGMTFGSKRQLSQTTKKWFENSGLQHVLVVSGTNVTLLFFLMFYVLAPLGKRIVFCVSIPVLLFFVALAGADPPVLRAAIMGVCILGANLFGRFPDLRNFLVLAVAFMGLFNPQMLQGNVSFFLSFMMMTGIICVTPVFYFYTKKFLRFLSEKVIVFLSVLFSAQVSIFFVITYFFSSFPTGGVFANLLVDPLVPFVMLGTFVTGLFGSIPILGKISGFFLEVILSGILFIAKIFSSFPVIQIHQIISLVGLFILCVFFIWSMISKKYEKKYWNRFLQESS